MFHQSQVLMFTKNWSEGAAAEKLDRSLRCKSQAPTVLRRAHVAQIALVLMFTKNWSEWSLLFEHRGH